MESDIGEISLEGSGMGSTMCPWDLNGICKDDECPLYVFPRRNLSLIVMIYHSVYTIVR